MSSSAPPARLAISVFDAEEVRAAIGGGADIIDCEDPRAAIGMFEPRVVTDIAYAVRQCSTLATPTSANIGLPQVVKGAVVGEAGMRSRLEVEAKAAQQALGLAAAMDVGDARPNIIKFEVDGLPAEDLESFVGAVKRAVRHSRQYQNHRVIASCLELDRAAWEKKRSEPQVIRQLLDLGEFYFHDGPDSIDLRDHYQGNERPKVKKMMEAARSEHPMVRLNEVSDPEALGFPAENTKRLKKIVEKLSAGGADGIMIDTPIQAKVAKITLRQTFSDDELKRFSEYCAYRRVECWLAGSIGPDDAHDLAAFPDVDVIMCRGAASAEVQNPFGGPVQDARSAKRISVIKVAELAEQVRSARK